MTARWPDFAIIGAMKSGTTTLHEQLAARSGLFLSDPKEPNFFSDDDQFARGADWYRALFAGARADQRCGESSTHYAKLPTHPHTVERLRAHVPEARFVYVMRDPIDRIVSQYIHEWTQCDVDEPIDAAVECHERFVAYSAYARQLEPYLRVFGADRVLPVFFERILKQPDAELERICRFIGDPSPEPVRWTPLPPRNVSAERLRRSALRDHLLAVPGVRRGARRVLPRRARERIKDLWRLRRRPELRGAVRARLQAALDADLARLGAWLGRDLVCESWAKCALESPPDWAAPPGKD